MDLRRRILRQRSRDFGRSDPHHLDRWPDVSNHPGRWRDETGIGLCLVAFTWIACSFVGALPYVLGDMFAWSNYDDALFESISGFSATGSTVLSDIEANGRGVLMWRQFTQWYGGMGMVVLAVTVLPVLGVGGLSLMSAEAPGHKSDRLTQRASRLPDNSGSCIAASRSQ